MEKKLFLQKIVEGTWSISLLKKIMFWEDVTMKLPGKWQKVVEKNNECVFQ